MSILLVDDSPSEIRLLQRTLERAGYQDIVVADCGEAALLHLGLEQSNPAHLDIECVLLDIVMPGLDGIEVCRRIKADPVYSDTPVIMVTMRDEVETLRDAFLAGAHDYITKPVRELELVARLKSALALTREVQSRKAHEQELLRLSEELTQANALLAQLTITDDLTKVGNRRYFMGCLDNEWRRSFREAAPVSLILVAIDNVPQLEEQLGRKRGEECLKMIAQVLQISLRRTTDHLARYNDYQFAIVLPKTPLLGAQAVAAHIRQSITELQVRHPKGLVTISQGVASVIPSGEMAMQNLLFLAEEAVLAAQKAGGDRVHIA